MAKPTNRGRTRRIGLVTTLVVLLVLLGVAGTMYAIGGKEIFTRVFAGEPKKDLHAGKVAVLVSPAVIPEFVAVDPITMIDPQVGDFHVQWVTQKAADDAGLIRDPNMLKGRVLNADHLAWQAFKESDFYPKGTQPSPTAAIRTGDRGVTLKAVDVPGLRDMKRRDHFDLVAVLPKTNVSSASNGTAPPDLASAVEDARSFDMFRKTIAQDAMIVVPVPKDAARSGGRVPEEAFVSLKDEEWFAYSDAIAKGAKMQLGARSGLPGGDTSPLELPIRPAEPGTITIISGSTSTRTLVPNETQNAGVKAKDPKDSK